MNFYSRTKPSLIDNIEPSQYGGMEVADPPVKDIVTSCMAYIYNHFIKDNIVWIIIICIVITILYFRSKKSNKTKKEKFNTDTQHLVTLNPTQRTFNGAVYSLPDNINMPNPEPYPAMNHTPYSPQRSFMRADQRTGSVNPYAYYPDSSINNYIGYSPDYLSTTSSFGKYYTEKNAKASYDIRRLEDARHRELEDNLTLGPSALSNVTQFEAPYAT